MNIEKNRRKVWPPLLKAIISLFVGSYGFIFHSTAPLLRHNCATLKKIPHFVFVEFEFSAPQLRQFCAKSGLKTPVTNYLNY